MKKYLFTLLFFLTAYAFGGQEEEAFGPEIIQNQIGNYFNTHNIEPYIPAGKGTATIEGYLLPHIDTEKVTARIFQLKFDNELSGMFVIVRNNDTGGVDSQLLCLSDKPLISPTLFFDILNSPMLYVTNSDAIKLRTKDGAQIFITAEDGNIDQGQLYTWTFFTHDTSINVPITLKSDGQGGTYFTMKAN